jgi:hypothetical protein
MNYVNAFNLKDALSKTSGLNLENESANLTRSWKASDFGSAADFAANFLASEKAKEGINYYLVVDRPVNDTKNKPFSVKSVSTKGPRKYKLAYPIMDENNVVYGSEEEKSVALATAKELVKTHKRNMIVSISKKVVEGEEIAAVVEYSPSKNTRVGSYLIFSK